MELYGQMYTRRKEFHRIAQKLLISRLLLECYIWQESNIFFTPIRKGPSKHPTVHGSDCLSYFALLYITRQTLKLWCLSDEHCPFLLTCLTLITALVSNYIYCDVWDEITYYSTLYQSCAYLSMLGLKLNRVSKGGPSNSSHKTIKTSIFAKLLFSLCAH